MSDEDCRDYHDHLTTARESMGAESIESALMWAAATALCSIADSMAKRVELTEVLTTPPVMASPILPTVKVADGAPTVDDLPDVYITRRGQEYHRQPGMSGLGDAHLPNTLTDGDGDTWRRLVDTDRYTSTSGSTAEEIRESYGLEDKPERG